ncbi:site-specific integrase [Paenibacillus larvae]|uniref:DNA integration/recombination/inversion protein n=1 Tax=Paenibacillus larvae subsp. larvae TaxID=147375 RepID=A0A6C0QZ13_9BACL|nr:site-specific integrase [Paenibacillus larvae]QHZ53953.1 DNA integration/recombination/inversion protein [Paenibacillus larvae subsp. larvae]
MPSPKFVYTILKSIFGKAKQWSVIKTNPMIGVDRPKGATRSRKYYDSEQIKITLQALQKEPLKWRLFFISCMIGGLRRSESLALEWSDIDYDDNSIFVRKSIAAGQKIKPPKTKQSIRKVRMPKWYFDELSKFEIIWNEEKETAGQKWEERKHSFIFHNGLGKPFYRTVPSQRWLQFIRANNLPHIRLHDLRHTVATLLLEEGVRLKVIQERHGHANYQTTADIYSHVTKRLTEDAVDKFEKFGPQSVPK